MIYTNIPAMYRKDAATLVDVVTNLKYRGLKPAEVEIYKKAVENNRFLDKNISGTFSYEQLLTSFCVLQRAFHSALSYELLE